jgi:hypothetical protein
MDPNNRTNPLSNMNEKIEAYVKSLGLNAPLLARLRQLHEICLPFASEIENAFIGQTKDQDGTDQCTGLLFFNNTLRVGFRDFLDSEANFHVARLRDLAVVNLTCGAILTDPRSPDTLVPRMVATFVWASNLQLQALATGQANCDQLISLYERYVLPALAGQDASRP